MTHWCGVQHDWQRGLQMHWVHYAAHACSRPLMYIVLLQPHMAQGTGILSCTPLMSASVYTSACLLPTACCRLQHAC